MKIKTILLGIVLVCFCFAQPKKYIREYTYEARSTDSKASSRHYSLIHLQAILLEEVGVFVENREKMKMLNDDEWYKQEVTSLSASITDVSVIEEKWDGETFWVKASVMVDDSKLHSQIDSHNDQSAQRNRIDNTNSAERSNLQESEDLQRKLDSVSVIPHVEPQRLAVTKREKQGAALWYNLAQHHEFFGDHDSSYVIFCYSSALEFNPFHSDALFGRGKLYRKREEVFKALEDFTAAIVADSTNSDYYRERAFLLADIHEYEAANRDFVKAIAMGHTDSTTHEEYVRSLMWGGSYDKAMKEAETYIERWPRCVYGYYNKAEIYYNQGAYKKTLKALDLAIKIDREYYTTYVLRGLAFEKLDKNKDAIKSYERALEIYPESNVVPKMIAKLKNI